MIMAGIWETWKGPDGKPEDTFAILTTAANNLITPIHDRMPVILHPSEYPHWLDRDQRDPVKLTRLFEPFPADIMEMHPVSSQVNSHRIDSPGCIEAV